MHLPRLGGGRTSKESATSRYPALPRRDEPGSVSEQRWTKETTLKPSYPSLHAPSTSTSFMDGLRQHQIRNQTMASRTRSSTMVERPGRGPGLGQPPRVPHFDKRMSRDDMMLTTRQYGKPLEKPAFDKRMSRDDMSIASKSYGMYSGIHNYDKRMSRDDMSITTRHYDRANYKSYHIPIRGRAPTPETSPHNDSLQNITTVRTSTPESMEDGNTTGVIAIGMALGSPAHPPWAQASQPQSVTMHNTVSASSLENHDSHDDGQAKTKTRKWGFFGRSKSKRGKGPEASPQPPPPPPPQPSTLISPPPETPATASSFNSGQEEPKRRKSLKRRTTVSRLQKPPLPETRLDPRQPPASIDLISASRLNLPGGPFLDVEIPKIEMERYSIMFGNVLNPQSSSSLLSRRQATLEKVNTSRDDFPPKSMVEKAEGNTGQGEEEKLVAADEWPRIRRGSSPQPARTPSFNIFPATPGKPGEIRGLTPNARSRTFPTVLPSSSSPLREISAAAVMPSEKPSTKVPAAEETGSSDVVSKSETTPKEHPRLVSKFTKSPAVMTSPRSILVESPSDIDEASVVHIQTRSAAIPESPAWQMMTPPHTAPSHTPAMMASRPAQPRSASPTKASIAPPPESEEMEQDRALLNAVEISIARQISVSRQQRIMLKPVQGSIRGRKDVRPNGVGISHKITMGRKGSTPTLVEPEGEDMTARAMHRKSSRGIMEDL